jgi:hypothetical protein
MNTELDAWTYKVRLAKIEKRLKRAKKDVAAGLPDAAERVNIHDMARMKFFLTHNKRTT